MAPHRRESGWNAPKTASFAVSAGRHLRPRALQDYLDLPLTRHDHEPLLIRVLQLRANFTAYDATYVALAEQLGAELVTGDGALARATDAYTAVPVSPLR